MNHILPIIIMDNFINIIYKLQGLGLGLGLPMNPTIDTIVCAKPPMKANNLSIFLYDRV